MKKREGETDKCFLFCSVTCVTRKREEQKIPATTQTKLSNQSQTIFKTKTLKTDSILEEKQEKVLIL